MRSILIPLGLLVITATGCQNQQNKYVARVSVKKGQKPFEQYFQSFNYPAFYADQARYKEAMQQARNQAKEQALYKTTTNASWLLEGPIDIGGRINCIEVHPTNSNELWIGTCNTGIYKTTNGGNTWTPKGEDFLELAISDIVFDPNNSNIMYAATGDKNISGNVKIGDGIYKSTDGGETWQNIGLSNTSIVSEIIIDPNNSNVIYASTMGKHYAQDSQRGVYKSTDAGATWSQILNTATDAGAIDLLMDPFNTNTLYCAMFNRFRTSQVTIASGPNSLIYKSIDGGSTWNLIMNGLPQGDNSRISLEASKMTPNLIFCSIVNSDYNLEGVYKSSNGGNSWTEVSGNIDKYNLFEFGWYFGHVIVSPYNDNELSLLGVDLQGSFDGGVNWQLTAPDWWTYDVHADKHDMVYVDANTVLLATDGGLYKGTGNFSNWQKIDYIPNTQFYRLAINPHELGVYTGGAQDNGTSSGNASDLFWPRQAGGDGFQAMYNPNDVGDFWAMYQNGGIIYTNVNTGNYEDWSLTGMGRNNWNTPFIMSKFNSSVFYSGTEMVQKNTTMPAAFWQSISPDLTDGNIYGDQFHNISALAEHYTNPDELYAGTSDGNVWRKSGLTWTNITNTLPDRYVSCIKTASNNAIFVTHTGYLMGDYTAYIYKSMDNGLTWTSIAGNLPPVAIYDVVIHENFSDQVLFVATDAGVYETTDGGLNWIRSGDNMPFIPVFDLEIDYPNNKLVAATFGRSMQSLDISSLITRVSQTNGSEQEPIFYPIPSHGFLFYTATQNIEKMTLYSSNGQFIKQLPTQKTLDISFLQPGIYFIETSVGKTKKISKIIRN